MNPGYPRLQMCRTLLHSGRCNFLAFDGGESGSAKLVTLKTEPRVFAPGNRIASGQRRQPLHVPPKFGRRKINYAIRTLAQVLDGLRLQRYAKQERPAQRPVGRHRRQVCAAVIVDRADQRYRRAEIQDLRLDGLEVFISAAIRVWRWLHQPNIATVSEACFSEI